MIGRFALRIASLGIGLAAAVAPASAYTIMVGDQARTFEMVRPAAGGRAPLVLVLHGMGGSGRQVEVGTGWGKLAASQGFAAVFPDAINGNWEFGTAMVGSPQNPDFRFLNKLIAGLVADGTADPKRVYITGISRGGAMTYAMVCGKAQLFAAAAPVIVGMTSDETRFCNPYRPVPMLFMNGTADPLIPYNGGYGSGPTATYNLMPVVDYIAFWRTKNGCAAATASETPLPDLDPRDKSTVRLIRSTCPEGHEVTLYKVVGGGHNEPRRPAPLWSDPVEGQNGPQNHDIDGASTIWAFFKQYAL